MKLFFDEDNGTGIPKALKLLRPPDLAAVEFPSNDRSSFWWKGTPDIQWLPWAGATGHFVVSQNSKILETPHEFELIVAHQVRILFILNGQASSWNVFRTLQARWSWLIEQDHRRGPLIWSLQLNGHVEPYDWEAGPRPSRRERVRPDSGSVP